MFEASNKKLDCEDEWSVILVSCGLWVQVKGKLIPGLLMGSAAVGALDQALQNDPGFRSDLAAASSKEPPVNMSGYGDLAGWLMTQVSELRRAKQADVAAVGASGESHPSTLLGDKDAAELASFNYVSGCMLDVATYREAMERLARRRRCKNSSGERCKKHMLATLPDCIRPCSRAMLCTGNHRSGLV